MFENTRGAKLTVLTCRAEGPVRLRTTRLNSLSAVREKVSGAGFSRGSVTATIRVNYIDEPRVGVDETLHVKIEEGTRRIQAWVENQMTMKKGCQ